MTGRVTFAKLPNVLKDYHETLKLASKFSDILSGELTFLTD